MPAARRSNGGAPENSLLSPDVAVVIASLSGSLAAS